MKKYIKQSKKGLNNQSVDVIIPTYNHAKYLKKAILSAIQQIGVTVNVIVVDDGSTDNTEEVISKCIKQYSQIRYYKQSNRGLSSARNLGLKQARSMYVAFLDADDFWLPNKLRLQISVFHQSHDSKLGLVYCGFNNVDISGKKLLSPSFNLIKEFHGSVFSQLLSGNYVAGSGSSVLIKKICFKKCGSFDETLESCEDWDMWLRISKEYTFDYVDKKLIGIRLLPNSMSKDQSKMCLGMAKLYDKNLDMTDNSESMRYLYGVIYPVLVREFPHNYTLKLIKSKIKPSSYHRIFRLTLSGTVILFSSIVNHMLTIMVKAVR